MRARCCGIARGPGSPLHHGGDVARGERRGAPTGPGRRRRSPGAPRAPAARARCGAMPAVNPRRLGGSARAGTGRPPGSPPAGRPPPPHGARPRRRPPAARAGPHPRSTAPPRAAPRAPASPGRGDGGDRSPRPRRSVARLPRQRRRPARSRSTGCLRSWPNTRLASSPLPSVSALTASGETLEGDAVHTVAVPGGRRAGGSWGGRGRARRGR